MGNMHVTPEERAGRWRKPTDAVDTILSTMLAEDVRVALAMRDADELRFLAQCPFTGIHAQAAMLAVVLRAVGWVAP